METNALITLTGRQSIDGENDQYELTTLGRYVKKDDKYKYFSLIPCVDSIVTIENALYKLSSGIVKRTDTYTVSNQVLEEDVKITIHEGRMFLIKASDK